LSSPRQPRPPLAAALALAAVALLPFRAAAEPLPVVLTSRDGRVAATVDLSRALPAELPERLGNGLRNVVAVFVAVVPEGSEEPSIGFARVIDVLFDVWEERWSVTVRDPQNPGGRRRVLDSAAELGQLLAHAADGDLGPIASLPASGFALHVRIDVNPVSPELLARTREYLAGAAGRPGGASRSVLGAVAGFLLREPEEDEGILLLSSAPLTAGSVRPR
jgi:hypothetical protein